jgi:hypothetical protein
VEQLTLDGQRKAVGKACRGCGIEQALDAYRRNANCSDGRDPICRDCCNERLRKARRSKRSRVAIELRRTNKLVCKACGLKMPVDHFPMVHETQELRIITGRLGKCFGCATSDAVAVHKRRIYGRAGISVDDMKAMRSLKSGTTVMVNCYACMYSFRKNVHDIKTDKPCCSPGCARAARRSASISKRTAECKVCGTSFVGRNPGQPTCGHRCAGIWRKRSTWSWSKTVVTDRGRVCTRCDTWFPWSAFTHGIGRRLSRCAMCRSSASSAPFATHHARPNGPGKSRSYATNPGNIYLACARRCLNPQGIAVCGTCFEQFPIDVNTTAKGQTCPFCKRARRYNASGMDLRRMWDGQSGACATCDTPLECSRSYPTPDAKVDHDHDSDEVRGWLCGRCNFLEGHVKSACAGGLMTPSQLFGRFVSYLESSGAAPKDGPAV